MRRGELLDHILSQMRREIFASRMIGCALKSLRHALGAEGAAVIDPFGNGVVPTALHTDGAGIDAVLQPAAALLANADATPALGQSNDGRLILACSSHTRFGEQTGLALWRAAGARPWDVDDCTVASSATAVVRMALEHETIQREMARQARTDPLTGLLNRRAFIEEVERRIDRLERERLPGTLIYADLDNFKTLNDRSGHEAGDDALRALASLLRDAVRPADLVSRLGGDEFALWLDGADHLTAAERAEALRISVPQRLASVGSAEGVELTLSIGIATREPGSFEDIESLTRRADEAMYEVKRAGRGNWRVSLAGPA
jgi:diguanylate cyclase (GGDEF)-like protein